DRIARLFLVLLRARFQFSGRRVHEKAVPIFLAPEPHGKVLDPLRSSRSLLQETRRHRRNEPPVLPGDGLQVLEVIPSLPLLGPGYFQAGLGPWLLRSGWRWLIRND